LPQERLSALLVEDRKCKWITTNPQNIRMKKLFYHKDTQPNLTYTMSAQIFRKSIK